MKEEIPNEIPLDADERDVKRWLAQDLVRLTDVSPERAKEIVDHAFRDALLDSPLPQ